MRYSPTKKLSNDSRMLCGGELVTHLRWDASRSISTGRQTVVLRHLRPFHRSLCLCERFLVLGDHLLVRVLGSRVAQDHSLERVGDDLMEGRLDNRVVHLPAARLDEICPGALVAALR